MVRAALKEMGLNLLAPDGYASPALTSVIAPQGIGGNKIRQYMRERFNIVLAGGQQKLDDVIFGWATGLCARTEYLGNIGRTGDSFAQLRLPD